MTETRIVTANELDRSYYESIYNILASEWKDADPHLSEFYRFTNTLINCDEGVLVSLNNGEVTGVMRTVRTHTGGNPAAVPDSFQYLIGPGWSYYDYGGGDTRILADLAVHPNYRGKGIATEIAKRALDFGEDNIGTYSPVTAVGFHERLGARKLREIPNARPGFVPPDVAVMGYRGFSAD